MRTKSPSKKEMRQDAKSSRIAVISRYTPGERDALQAAARINGMEPKVFQKQAAMVFAGQVLKAEMESRNAVLNGVIQKSPAPAVQGGPLAEPTNSEHTGVRTDGESGGVV